MCQRLVVILALIGALLSSCAPSPTLLPSTSTHQVFPTTPPDTLTPLPPTPMTGCVVGTTLRVRAEPNTQSETLGGLTAGQCVSVYGTNPERTWASVSNSELAGWVSLEYLEVVDQVDVLPVAGEPVPENQIYSLQTELAGAPPTVAPTIPRPRSTSVPVPALPSALKCVDTDSQIGDFVSCTIPRAYCAYHPEIEGYPTFCSDPPYPGHKFTLLVWGSDWSDLDGQCIVVSGLVENYQGKPEIVASSRSQVYSCR